MSFVGYESPISGFIDAEKFMVDEFGQARHRRDGETYADRLMNGVALDTSLHWDSEQIYCIIDPEETEEIVGDRTVSSEIQEVTRCPGKERGEGKFYRERKVPKKKNKNYPTKPKPKHSWHKRISRVAEMLGDVNDHTFMGATEEAETFYEMKHTLKELRIMERDNEYLRKWYEAVSNNPGQFAVLKVNVPIDESGERFYGVDVAGIVRCSSENYQEFWGNWWREHPQYDVYPKHTSFYVYTYWNVETERYEWHTVGQGIHPENPIYLPGMKNVPVTSTMFESWVDMLSEWEYIMFPDELHQWDIRWDVIWRKLNYLRTGYNHDYEYYQGSWATWISQIPLITFSGTKNFYKDLKMIERKKNAYNFVYSSEEDDYNDY